MTSHQRPDELKNTIHTSIAQAFLKGKEHHSDDVDFPVDSKTYEIMSLIATHIEDIEIRHVKELEEMHDSIASKVLEGRLDELRALDRNPQMFGDWQQIVLDRIATLQARRDKQKGETE